MRFRRIYWVTEQFDESGKSEVTGVYTSTYDLIETGLGVRESSSYSKGYRATLCELDSKARPVLSFSSEEHGSLQEELEPLVQSGEMTRDDATRLVEEVGRLNP